MLKYTSAVKLHQEGSLIKKSGTNKWITDRKFVRYLDYENKVGKIVVPK